MPKSIDRLQEVFAKWAETPNVFTAKSPEVFGGPEIRLKPDGTGMLLSSGSSLFGTNLQFMNIDELVEYMERRLPPAQETDEQAV